MITSTTGNILNAQTEALVNTVNTHGIMGKGIALAFKKAFPDNYNKYRRAFEKNELRIGRMFVSETNQLVNRYVINFPTKKHWRQKSEYEYIERGLKDLKNVLAENKIRSVAIPPLGCGNGGLDWKVVKDMIVNGLKEFESNTEIIIYEPIEISNFQKPKSVDRLTPARAMLLYVLRNYETLGENANPLVAQKIGYFLQRMGEPMKLRIEKGWYGPYALNLNRVLEVLSPKYIKYSGDLNEPYTHIAINENALDEINTFIRDELSNEQRDRLTRVLDIMIGFENAFGIELLSTVAYAMEECPTCTENEIVEEVHNWTDRKKEMMQENHIIMAYRHIKNFETSHQNYSMA